MTPLEKARMRHAQNEKPVCITCKKRVVIDGVSYCEKDGKILHPMLLEPPFCACPLEIEKQRTKTDTLT